MEEQASIRYASGCCNAPSKIAQEAPVHESSKVRETQDVLSRSACVDLARERYLLPGSDAPYCGSSRSLGRLLAFRGLAGRVPPRFDSARTVCLVSLDE